MSPLNKLVIGIVVVALAAFALVANFVQVRETLTSVIAYTTNAGELQGDALVGQTFVAEKNNLSGIGVLLATYSNRANVGTVQFHLRSLTDLGQDIRVVSVSATELKDNQTHRFLFDPIPESSGQTYIFYLAAPQSVVGKAVTVDLDTRDPYHRGSAYIVRGKGDEATSLTFLAVSGKPTVDVAFETYHTVSLREALVNKVVSTTRYVIGTWPEKRSEYGLYGRVLFQTVLVLLGIIMTWRSVYEFLVRTWGERKFTFFFLTLFLVAGFWWRLSYAMQLPVTYDEGNYLYDARTWLQGHMAGGDGYVKSPAVIAWVALWQWFLGNTVIAGRLASVLVGALTLYPIYFLARELFAGLGGTVSTSGISRRVGLAAAALWAGAGTAVVGSVYVHTQPLSIFFSVWGLAVLALALRGTTPRLTFLTRPSVPSVHGWFVLSGMLLGMGVASRKSILALGLVPLLLIFLLGKSWKLRMKHVFAMGMGFLLVIALFLGFAWWVYGPVGVQEAIGINSAEDGITAVDPAEVEQVRAYSLRGMTPFFRESLPIILLLTLGLGATSEQLIRSFFRIRARKPEASLAFLADHVVPKLGWIVALGVFWWAWGFFTEYEGQAFMFWGIPAMWYAFLVLVIGILVSPRLSEEAIVWDEETVEATDVPFSKQPGFTSSMHVPLPVDYRKEVAGVKDYAVGFLTVLVWAGGLVFFYMNWIKFHANYISEFIPPLIIMAGAGVVLAFDRVRLPLFMDKDYPVVDLLYRLLITIIVGIVGWALFTSNYITYVHEHTGSYSQSTLTDAAAWAKHYIPQDEPIFTGAALVPYLSGHHTALDIAHPRWYAYEFTRTNVDRFNTFLPPVKDMEAAFDKAQWFLYDEQTRFSFFMEYDRIKNDVEQKFTPVQDFDGLVFYRRVKQ